MADHPAGGNCGVFCRKCSKMAPARSALRRQTLKPSTGRMQSPGHPATVACKAGQGGARRPGRVRVQGLGGLRSPDLMIRNHLHYPGCATSPGRLQRATLKTNPTHGPGLIILGRDHVRRNHGACRLVPTPPHKADSGHAPPAIACAITKTVTHHISSFYTTTELVG